VSAPFDAGADLADAPLVAGAALRPRHAATLVLIRRDGPEPRLLMGRRAGGHVFMAAKWVFPGGRLDRSDYGVPAARELEPATRALLERTAPPRRARALALAAVRETFEETGLILGRASVAAGRAPTRGSWRAFLDRGLLPDLEPLRFIARAITPPGRTRRFDTRFFLADAQALASLEPGAGCGELEETAWFGLPETAALDLPAITRFVLAEIAARLAEPGRPAPYVRMVRGRHVVGVV
jgi:8-oxo-dGTP pyrophosphatase MutT (NUDIX family)